MLVIRFELGLQRTEVLLEFEDYLVDVSPAELGESLADFGA